MLVWRTHATLTSQPLIQWPSGAFAIRALSWAFLSGPPAASISSKVTLSSYPEAVGMPEFIISSTIFWDLSASFRRFVSSSRSSDDEIRFSAKDSRN